MAELLKVKRLTVSTGIDDEAHDVAEDYARPGLTARWIGLPDAVAKHGTSPNDDPTTMGLAAALRGTRVDGTGFARHSGRVSRTAGPGGERTVGLVHATGTMALPEPVAAAWSRADDSGRAEIAAIARTGMDRALEHLVTRNAAVERREGGRRWTEAAQGHAAVATVQEGPANRWGGHPTLTVEAILVGVLGSDDRMAPVADAVLEDAAAIEAAGDVGLAAIMTELERRGYVVGPEHVVVAEPTGADKIPYEDVEVKHPLERYRQALGDRMYERMRWLAGTFETEKERQSTEQLLARRAELKDSFKKLDPVAALEAGRLQKRREVVEAEGDKYRRWTETLTTRLQTTPEGRTRARLVEEANRKAAIAEGLRQEWRSLMLADLELGDRHPSVWYRDNGAAAAELATIHFVVARRHEHALLNEIERSFENPPEQLGPAPEDARDRARWEDLVRRTERARLERERDERDGPEVAGLERPRGHDERLAADVRRWQKERGLASSGPEQAADTGYDR